jgi:uncharacterized SAM-binding protein YcdF (DUF218 family)
MGQGIKAITEFIFPEDKPKTKSVVIVLGTYRPEIPRKAFSLYKQGLAKLIITTGGVKKDEQDLCEAEFQKDYLVKKGVPQEIIFAENTSTNTKENAENTYELIKKNKISSKNIILVSKTYHARRLYMTFRKVFPQSNISLVTTTDERQITRSNWYKTKEKREKVMEEVEKIGKYYLQGDLEI